MTVDGIVRRKDIEGGIWILETPDGPGYQLAGGDDGLRVDGQRVEVDGEVQRSMISLGMSGPILRVTKYRTR